MKTYIATYNVLAPNTPNDRIELRCQATSIYAAQKWAMRSTPDGFFLVELRVDID